LRAAADNLVPVTLELGGKSPTIVGRTADIAKAADRIVFGKMLNAGQICLAPDYALVPAEMEQAFVKSVREAVARMYPTLLTNEDYTSVVNERHHVRLSAYLDDARTKGARVIEVNPGNEDFGASNSNKMPLYLVFDVTDDMKVMQEELFGPILPVRRYDQIEEAIDYINAHDRPLGLYYFSKDETERRQVLDRTISGGVTLDDVLFHAAEELPFGGIGPAGMGSYHGIDGFRTFSHAKAVYKQTKIDIIKLGGVKPPFNKTTRSTIERALKHWRA
jgi:coniferyl-aldehyde dehydrogenase